MPTPLPRIFPGQDRLLHGGDYNPDQWLHAPEVIDEDFRLMPLAGCNTFSVGIFAWAALEPREGEYTFAWLDTIMDRLAAGGHNAMLATPSGAKPAWMSLKYPEIRRVDRQGQREPHLARHNHCWSSPVYREKVRQINTALAERYGRHPALRLWHISNEYGGECLCPLCLAAWQRWLERRYETLDRLNHAWWTGFWSHRFSAWEEIDPRDWSMDGLMLDWHRFVNWQIQDFYRWEIEPLKRLSPSIPCTTNFMGLHWQNDYTALAAEVDLVADDQYPAYDPESPEMARVAVGIGFKDDLYRCLKPDRPWMLMESCPEAPQWKKPNRLKRPGLHRAEMLQAIGHGAEGTCYFQWRKGRGGNEKFHGAVVDHAGSTETRTFRTVARLGRLYDKLRPVLGSRVVAEIAFLYDHEARLALHHSDGPDTAFWEYDRVCHDFYQPYWENGYSVDVLAPNRDWGAHRIVVAPQLWMLRPGMAQRLRDFVAAGGDLVLTWNSAVVDASNLCLLGGLPGDGLREVFGIWQEEIDALPSEKSRRVALEPGNRLGLSGEYAAQRCCGVLRTEGAEVLARYAEDFYHGAPALTVNAHGRGRAWYVAARPGVDFLRQLMPAIARLAGVRPAIAADIPRGVSVQRRIAADGARFYFAQNFTNQAQVLHIHEPGARCMESDEPIGPAIDLVPCGSVIFRCAP